MSPEAIGLVTAVFIASAVEVVEAFTIVLAMGLTRDWRSALTGTGTALVALALFTVILGLSLGQYVNEALLQFVIGILLLNFGAQWLRKAILRASGLKAMHDEEKIFAEEATAVRSAGTSRFFGIDWFAFVVSFKGVFLEGIEVVFIVITFGLGASHKGVADAMLLATSGAIIAAVMVVIVGSIVRRPLSMVPENTLKFAVGLMLSSFGLFWTLEGLGYFQQGQEGLSLPGDTISLVAIFAAWSIISWVTVRLLRVVTSSPQVGTAS